MTTIASPRPSLALSSRRTSFSTDVSGKPDPNSNRQQHVTAQRRNRAALRDFYKLNDQPARDSLDTTTDTSSNHDEKSPQSIVDREGFDADRYVQELLERESLEGLMKVEAGLLKDIRGFDGERKSLVYDNYSKLIGATDTIKKVCRKLCSETVGF